MAGLSLNKTSIVIKMELMNRLEHTLQEEIISLKNLIFLLDEAARTERFLSKPRHPGTPSMYDAILTT